MVVIGTSNLLFGLPDEPNRIPIQLPDDVVKVRVRFRHDDFAKCWLKTSMGIRAFYLVWTDESRNCLKSDYEHAANFKS